MHRKLLLLFAIGLIVLFGGAHKLEAKPNIVLISTDDQRADELFGMPVVRRKFTKEGTTFTRAFAPFPLCCPARASIMSGQYAHNHHVLSNVEPLGGYSVFNSSTTLATWLRSAGYQTAFVGKYLNGYNRVHPMTVPPGWMDWHAFVNGDYFNTRLRESTGGPPATFLYTGQYQVDLYSDKAVEAINRLIGAPAPLFLWVSYFAPHEGGPVEPDDPAIGTPAVAPRHRDAFAGTPLRKEEYDPSFNETDVSDKPVYIQALPPLSADMQAQMTELYQQRLESLLAVDEGVAKIFQAVEASGELANTIFVFTSDNGYMLGEHRIPREKSVPYTPSQRVPLMIRGPGFPAGLTVSSPVAHMDLVPTFLQAARATAGLPQDGVSLFDVVANPAVFSGRELVVEAGPQSRNLDDPWFYRGIRTARWAYIEYGATDEVELYDLANDPYQQQNVAAIPAYAADRQRLARRLLQLRNCVGIECH